MWKISYSVLPRYYLMESSKYLCEVYYLIFLEEEIEIYSIFRTAFLFQTM